MLVWRMFYYSYETRYYKDNAPAMAGKSFRDVPYSLSTMVRVFVFSWLPVVVNKCMISVVMLFMFGDWKRILLAEAVTSIYTALCIITNHSGSDVYKFGRDDDDDWAPPRNSSEFYCCQAIASVNFYLLSKHENEWSGLFAWSTGYLGLQIEHHMFESDSPLVLIRAAPLIKQVCATHGVPYIHESLVRRVSKTFAAAIGLSKKQTVIPYSVVRDCKSKHL